MNTHPPTPAQPTYHWQRILVTGVPFAGKTLGSLYLAKGMLEEGKEIVVVSTDPKIDTYSELVDFMPIYPQPPYTPDIYITAINLAITECKNIGVLIVDNISRECIEIERLKDKWLVDNPKDDKWACWEQPHLRPAHYEFMKVLLNVPCHLIATATCKEELIVGEGTQVKANGSPILMKNTGADFDMHFEIMPDTHHFKVDHRLGVHKLGIFKPANLIDAGSNDGMLTEAVGAEIMQHLLDAANGRKSRDMLKHELITQFTAEEIGKKWAKYVGETEIPEKSPSALSDDAFRLFAVWCVEGM